MPTREAETIKSRERKPRVALLLIDVINTFDFPGSTPLVNAALRMAPNIDRLVQRARASGVAVVYVNDNFGRWRSDFRAIVKACTSEDRPGGDLAKLLAPHEGDYFVLKPQYSGFFSTTLQLLLEHLRVQSLVLAGFATNLCIAFTAHDAHMHGYQLWVPSDCTASNTPLLTRTTLAQLRCAVHAHTPKSASINFAVLARQRKKPRDVSAA